MKLWHEVKGKMHGIGYLHGELHERWKHSVMRKWRLGPTATCSLSL